MKRNEARKLNHKEVAEEDMRKKLPKNYEAMRRKAEWEVADKQARQVQCILSNKQTHSQRFLQLYPKCPKVSPKVGYLFDYHKVIPFFNFIPPRSHVWYVSQLRQMNFEISVDIVSGTDKINAG